VIVTPVKTNVHLHPSSGILRSTLRTSVILCIGVTYGNLVTSSTETFILNHRFEVKTCLGVCHTCSHIRPMLFVLLGSTFDCANGTDCASIRLYQNTDKEIVFIMKR
jgi:hypothetical protein